MARTVTEIHNEILDNISNDAILSSLLTSTSTTAIYRVFAYVVAVSINLLEVMIDQFRDEVTEIRNTAVPATEQWYVWRAKRFQYDASIPQNLTFDETDYSIDYDTIDESKRIITVAAVSTNENREVIIKVAKGDTTLERLDTQELDAFISYMQTLRSAGQRLVILSNDPDKLTVSADIYYDAQLLQSTVLTEIQNNINTYLQNLEFDGTLRYQKVIDAIQSSTGVKDLKIFEMSARPNVETFDNRTIFDRVYKPSSGYLIIDQDRLLETTLNLIAV